MKFPIFASFIVLCLLITIRTKKQIADHKKKEEDFLEKESLANSVRKKSLDDLEFISIPFDSLPTPALATDAQEEFDKAYEILKNLDSAGIVNLSGITNTELKLKYGVANLETLIGYDQNYSDTLIGLNLIGHILAQANLPNEACKYLEYAVSIHTDICATYELLVRLYTQLNMLRRIDNMIPLIENLNSPQKDKILKILQQK